eukprot:4134468-Amphidinium_carterae.1
MLSKKPVTWQSADPEGNTETIFDQRRHKTQLLSTRTVVRGKSSHNSQPFSRHCLAHANATRATIGPPL